MIGAFGDEAAAETSARADGRHRRLSWRSGSGDGSRLGRPRPAPSRHSERGIPRPTMIAAMTPVVPAAIGTVTFKETPNAEATKPATVPRQAPMMTIRVRFLAVSTCLMSGHSHLGLSRGAHRSAFAGDGSSKSQADLIRMQADMPRQDPVRQRSRIGP